MTEHADTIVAAATPPGTGGIGIVRISGPMAANVAGQMVGDLPEPRIATNRTFRDAAGSVAGRERNERKNRRTRLLLVGRLQGERQTVPKPGMRFSGRRDAFEGHAGRYPVRGARQ